MTPANEITDGSLVLFIDNGATPAPDTLIADNVIHQPAYNDTDQGPLSSNIIALPTSKGYIDPDGGVPNFVAGTETPADTVKDSKPLAGSNAIGTAVMASVRDVYCDVRAEPRNQGCW